MKWDKVRCVIIWTLHIRDKWGVVNKATAILQDVTTPGANQLCDMQQSKHLTSLSVCNRQSVDRLVLYSQPITPVVDDLLTTLHPQCHIWQTIRQLGQWQLGVTSWSPRLVESGWLLVTTMSPMLMLFAWSGQLSPVNNSTTTSWLYDVVIDQSECSQKYRTSLMLKTSHSYQWRLN